MTNFQKSTKAMDSLHKCLMLQSFTGLFWYVLQAFPGHAIHQNLRNEILYQILDVSRVYTSVYTNFLRKK